MSFSIALCYNMFAIVFIHYHFFQVFNIYISELNTKTENISRIVEDLNTSKKAFLSHDRFQKIFITAIAHDIKGPLKYLALSTKSIALQASAEAGDKETELKKGLSLIQKSSSKIYHVSENLVQYAMFNLDKEIESSIINVHHLVEDKIKIFADMAIAQNNTINNTIDPEIRISISPQLLGIIVHNILDNAIKFTENDAIQFSATFKESELYLSIADNGRGMPPKLMAWCNTPSSQTGDLDSEENVNKQGLGLLIVKELLSKTNGRLEVSSNHSKGTIVTIVVPSQAA